MVSRSVAFPSILVALVALLLTPPTFAAPAQEGNPPYRKGEVIIKFRDNATTADVNAIMSDLGGTRLKHFQRIKADQLHVSKFSTAQAVDRYKNNPKVVYIEPNYVWKAVVTPNDPSFPQQWSLENTGQTGGVPGADINATAAWGVSTGSDSVLVAVIDTGVDYNHPDLAENIWTNQAELNGLPGVDDDGNGYIDDIHGYNFAYGIPDPMDDNGHGTHCSGTIGAVSNNGVGITGVTWHVRIMALKFLDSFGSGSSDGAISAIDYAISNGARVLSNSWGGDAFSQGLLDAIERAREAGVVFVAAAGNASSNVDLTPFYPAAYPSTNIVSVAASDAYDQLASFSNYGATTVDLAAPGVDILSTFPFGGYAYLSGTSMACPHVSGALALLLSTAPGLTPEAMRQLLITRGSDPESAFAGKTVSGGRLNLLKLLSEPDSIPPGSIANLTTSDANGSRIDLHWTATGDDGASGQATAYEIRRSSAPITPQNFDAATPVPNTLRPQAAGSPETFRVTGLSFTTTYYFALRALDEYSNHGPVSNGASGTTLSPPSISVSPGSFEETLLTGQNVSRPLTVSNAGPSELQVRFGAKSSSIGTLVGATLETRVPRPAASTHALPAGPVLHSDVAYDHDARPRRERIMPAEIKRPSINGSTHVLIVQSGGDVSEIQNLLATFSDLPVVDMFDAAVDVPSTDLLADYDAILLVANRPFGQGVALGDRLADFADAGGGVVMTLATFIQGWNLEGRFLNDGYMPFLPGFGPIGSSPLGTFDPLHPIMQGVTYVQGDLLGGVELAPGAVGVANWAFGYPFVATQGPNVAAVNIFVGASGYWTGDVPLILHNALVWANHRARWLSADPPTAVVPAGTNLGVAVKMDATGLDGGDYSSALTVDSDDPAHAHLELPALLHVIGAPDILLSRTSIAFGSLFIGLTRAESLIVSNPGSETLNVTQITLDNPHYQVTPTTLSLLPRHNAVLEVRYVPATEGPDIGHLTLHSNDPDEGVVVVDLTGTAVPPPDIEVHPDSVSLSLLSGQTATRTLEVWNYGATTLDYQVSIADPLLATAMHATIQTSVDVVGAATPVPLSSLGPGGPPKQTTVRIDPKDAAMPDRGASATRGGVRAASKPSIQGEEIFGAPNYQFIGGPRSRGNIFMCTTSTTLEEHRFFLGPLAVSQLWFLVYEGQTQSGAYTLVSASNMTPVPPIEGWYSSGPVNVPMIAGRFYIVCASFDAPSAYYNDQLIAPYPISASFGTLIAGAGWDWAPTAQFPPDTMQFVPPEAFGSPVAYYQAIVTGLGTSWLTADPGAGSLPPGLKQDVILSIDSDGLIGGDYRADVRFTSNDPDEPSYRVPVKLHVTGVPDIATVESQLDFPTTFIGLGSSLDLHIVNRGTSTLDITSINVTGDFFEFPTSVSLAARESTTVTVVFVPQASGTRTGTLTLQSNDPDQPTLTIPVQGLGVAPPVASVSPTSVSASLVPGEKITKTVLIKNNGGSPLTFDLVLRTLGFKAPAPSLTAGTDAAGAIAAAPDAGNGTVATTGDRISTIGATPIAAGVDATNGTNAVVTVGAPRARVDGQNRHKPIGASGLYPAFHNRMVAIPGQVVVFYDNMEQGANGWTFQNYGPDSLASWHQTQRAYNSPTHSWWCGVESQGDYNTGNEVKMAVVSPQIDLRGAQAPVTLEFYENFETEFGWDFCMVDASVDGSNWVPLRGGLHEAPSGSSGGWRNSAVDLSAFAGHITYLRFYFDTIDPVANAYPGWFFDDVLVTAAGVPWLSATPQSGEIAPGDGVNVQLDFDATGLALGSYGAEIVINSNDPVHPQLGVQVALDVVTQPQLAVPDTFDVGDVFVGYPETASMPVKNLGTQTLVVNNIFASGAGFSVTPTSLTVAPLDSVTVGVHFAPTSAGPRTGLLVFSSNDPSTPDSVVLTARGLLPPIARLTPGDITASMPPDGHGSAIVSLFNDGGSNLVYFARVASVAPGGSITGPAITGVADVAVASTRPGGAGRTIASEAVAAVVDAVTPAPDPIALGNGSGSGYAWKDSDEPDGPAFGWVDIRTTGTPVPFPTFAEDDNVGPLPIGFSFPFYSGSFSSFRASVNGWVSFTSALGAPANTALPSAASGVPENVIAPLWDDLIFDGTLGSKAWYRSDGSRLVIQYENLFRSFLPQVAGPHGASTEAISGLPPTYTFEIILDSNGEITFQYYELGNITNGATVGIQNATRTAGLQVAYNQAYLHSGLAIRMEPPGPPWVVFPPSGGTVAPGASGTLALGFDATGLAEGTYRAQLLVQTNDPSAPQLTRDIVLTVEQPIVGDLQIQPRVLNPGRNGQWIRGDLQLPVGSSLQDVVIASVRMNGVVPANTQDFTFQVEEGTGRPTLNLKFDRGATMSTLPPGADTATFVMTGGLTTGQHFVATDRIQVTGHHLTAPNGGEQIVALSNYLVSWSVPSDWPIEQATIDLSWNGGVTWQSIGQSVGSSWMWTVPAQTGNDVRLRVTLSDANGIVSQDVSDASFQIVAPVADADIAPIGAVALRQNQPNPFRGGTGIRFDLPRSVPIRLVVFDLAGRSVRTLAQGSWPAGKQQIFWDGTDDRGVRLRAGVYLYRLEAEEFSATRRMCLLE